jgi:hypothetical protein
MFEGQAGAYQSEALFRLLAYTTNFRLDCRGLPKQTIVYYANSKITKTKSFITLGPAHLFESTLNIL